MEVECFEYTVGLADHLVFDHPRTVRRQVREYVDGSRSAFDLRFGFPDGFDGRVAEALCAIPYGLTRTYGDVANELGTSPRAVGGACARNPLPILIPCHRLRRTDGSLGGYQYPGLKERLLAHESQ